MTISDAPSCYITYDHHSDDSRGFIYDVKCFIKLSQNNSGIFLMFQNRSCQQERHCVLQDRMCKRYFKTL